MPDSGGWGDAFGKTVFEDGGGKAGPLEGSDPAASSMTGGGRSTNPFLSRLRSFPHIPWQKQCQNGDIPRIRLIIRGAPNTREVSSPFLQCAGGLN
jgi:hypothetical protein